MHLAPSDLHFACPSSISCAPSPPRFPVASDAGRRACVEEVQANYAPNGRVEAMKRCLRTIDQRIGGIRSGASAVIQPVGPPVSEPPRLRAVDRLAYCRIHQADVQAAERDRQRAQSVWMSAAKQVLEGSPVYEKARRTIKRPCSDLKTFCPRRIDKACLSTPTRYRSICPAIPASSWTESAAGAAVGKGSRLAVKN